MRNAPLKAFAKKGKSPLPQTFVQPDLSFLNNQSVSDSDSIKNTSLDTNQRIKQDIDDKIAIKKSKIPKGTEHLYDEKGNPREIDPGSIDIPAMDKFIQARREANPIYNTVKSMKNIYDAL